ncbi:MAG: nitroreductase family protein [Oscillospiraceae bacterium]
MYNPIEDRRSIRSFSDRDVPDETIRALIAAGTKAPSSKNRQPWRFTVVRGAAKQGMLDAFAEGLQREERQPLLPGSKQHLAGARYTHAIMKQAPVTVFVLNTLGQDLYQNRSPEEKMYDLANVQSVGAAIQNILLAATNRGLAASGSATSFLPMRSCAAGCRRTGSWLPPLRWAIRWKPPTHGRAKSWTM